MKLAKFLAFTFGAAVLLSSCRNNDDDDDNGPAEPETTLSGSISANKQLTSDKVWTLKGYVYVTSGTTLSIEAGTVIKSDVTEKGALIIEPGAKLMAEGTESKPIVFTSGKAVGDREPGDWGGIILLGKAPTNRGTTTLPTIEGGVGRTYGGTDPEDNSGTLRYVRIEYAGIAAQPNSEINALTCGGVGSKTIIEHVMTAYANDDAYEFFGGTVSPKYLVAYATADDDFDFDFGYSGTIQYAVSLRDPRFVDPGDAGNGIECDNDGNGTEATPNTHPVLSNLTIIGPNNATGTAGNHNYGNRWRRAARFTFINSIILGTQKGGVSIESKLSYDAYMAGQSEFKNNIIYAVTKPFTTDSSTARAYITTYPANPISKEVQAAMIAEAAAPLQAKAVADGNLIATSADEVALASPFNLTAPDFLPKGGSPALSGTFVSKPGIETVTFRGAFGTTNWLNGWTNFDPQSKVY